MSATGVTLETGGKRHYYEVDEDEYAAYLADRARRAQTIGQARELESMAGWIQEHGIDLTPDWEASEAEAEQVQAGLRSQVIDVEPEPPALDQVDQVFDQGADDELAFIRSFEAQPLEQPAPDQLDQGDELAFIRSFEAQPLEPVTMGFTPAVTPVLGITQQGGETMAQQSNLGSILGGIATAVAPSLLRAIPGVGTAMGILDVGGAVMGAIAGGGTARPVGGAKSAGRLRMGSIGQKGKVGLFNQAGQLVRVMRTPRVAHIGKNLPKHKQLSRLEANLKTHVKDAKLILRLASPHSLEHKDAPNKRR